MTSVNLPQPVLLMMSQNLKITVLFRKSLKNVKSFLNKCNCYTMYLLVITFFKIIDKCPWVAKCFVSGWFYILYGFTLFSVMLIPFIAEEIQISLLCFLSIDFLESLFFGATTYLFIPVDTRHLIWPTQIIQSYLTCYKYYVNRVGFYF